LDYKWRKISIWSWRYFNNTTKWQAYSSKRKRQRLYLFSNKAQLWR